MAPHNQLLADGSAQALRLSRFGHGGHICYFL
jgi:hypothetical protein